MRRGQFITLLGGAAAMWLAEPWRPWRGAAARMLWTYCCAAKQRDGAPIGSTESMRRL